MRIYKTCIKPILIYAAETRAETSKMKRTLRVAEMRTLKAIKAVIRRNRVRNKQIRKECNIQDILR